MLLLPLLSTPAEDDNPKPRSKLSYILAGMVLFNWMHVGCLILLPFLCGLWGVIYILATVVLPPTLNTGSVVFTTVARQFVGSHYTIVGLVIITAYGFGRLAELAGQPRVVGEILVGVIAGQLLTSVAANGDIEAQQKIFQVLLDLGRIGIVLYLLLAGLQLDISDLRGRGGTALLVSGAALVVPLVIGTAVGKLIYTRYGQSDIDQVVFSIFLGTVVAVSALPVLIRILDERKLLTTRLGTLAVGCASVDDLLAWLLFAWIMTQIPSVGDQSPLLGLWGIILLTMLIIVASLLWQYFAGGWNKHRGTEAKSGLSAVLATGLLIAGAGESFGLHGGVGAFFAGVFAPFARPLRNEFVGTAEPVVAGILVPAFFVYAGSQIRLSSIHDQGLWILIFGLTVMAILAKGGTTYCIGRLKGLRPRDAAGLAALLNARGVMGLIVLTAGLDAGVISHELFTALVIMVLATNLLVAPALHLFRPAFDLKG